MKKSPPATALPAFDSAPTIELIAGEVVVIGPGRVGFSMTPGAALLFSERLSKALESPPA